MDVGAGLRIAYSYQKISQHGPTSCSVLNISFALIFQASIQKHPKRRKVWIWRQKTRPQAQRQVQCRRHLRLQAAQESWRKVCGWTRRSWWWWGTRRWWWSWWWQWQTWNEITAGKIETTTVARRWKKTKLKMMNHKKFVCLFLEINKDFFSYLFL